MRWNGFLYRKYLNFARDIITVDINQIIEGDVAEFNVKGKDHFCASLTNRHNYEAIGIAVSDKNDTTPVLAALENAHHNCPDLCGCVHHTDADVRYGSDEYTI